MGVRYPFVSLRIGAGAIVIHPEGFVVQQLVKLCFAYPSLDFAAGDELGGLTPTAAQAFRAMFVGKPVWIAGTDFF